MNTNAEVISALRGSSRVLLVCHYNPDGDAIGASSALGHALLRFGKHVSLYNYSKLPEHFSWLALPAPFNNDLDAINAFAPDLIVILDCGDLHRIGPDLAPLLADKSLMPWGQTQIINIDHHLGNPAFGDLNLLESKAAATAFIVGQLIEEMGQPLDGNVGQGVYLGIFSDSGGFSYPNTNAEILEMAARIVRSGLEVGKFTDRVVNNWSVNRMRLWGKLWSELEVLADGQIVISTVRREHLENTETTSEDLDSYASFLRRLKGVRATLMLREHKDGTCKASFRSDGDLDVRNAALAFGGGGHKAAAGAESKLGIDEFLAQAKEALLQQLGK